MASVRTGLLFAAGFYSATLAMKVPVVWAALSSENAACRDFIAKKVLTLEDTVLREQLKCHQNRSGGLLGAAVDCSDVNDPAFPGAAAVAKAAAQLSSGVATKCAAASTPAANGYTSCPSPCTTSVPSISSYNDVGACLICQTKEEAAAAIQAVFGAAPPVQGTKNAAWKCQNTSVGEFTPTLTTNTRISKNASPCTRR